VQVEIETLQQVEVEGSCTCGCGRDLAVDLVVVIG
jgi:hypothetical protein